MTRVFGSLCMFLGAALAALGLWGYLEHRGTLSSAPLVDYGEVTKDGAGLYLLGSLAAAIVVATIGASAVMAAHAVDRLTRARYLPKHQPPPPTPAGRWSAGINPNHEPLDAPPVGASAVHASPTGQGHSDGQSQA